MRLLQGKSIADLAASDYQLSSGSIGLPSDRPDVLAVWVGGVTPKFVGGKRIKDVATTTYTLLLADLDKILRFTSADPVLVTVPLFATTPIHPGCEFDLIQAGAGAVTFSDAGATVINSASGEMAIVGQNGRVKLLNVDEDTWNLSGDVDPGV